MEEPKKEEADLKESVIIREEPVDDRFDYLIKNVEKVEIAEKVEVVEKIDEVKKPEEPKVEDPN